MGQVGQSLDVLKTVMSLKERVLDENDENIKAYNFAIYRTMCEIQVCTDFLNEIIKKNSLQISMGKSEEAKTTLKKLCQTESDAIANNKLKNLAENQEDDDTPEDLEDLVLPDFRTEAVTCYAYFLTLTGHVQYALSFLDDILKTNLKPFLR